MQASQRLTTARQSLARLQASTREVALAAATLGQARSRLAAVNSDAQQAPQVAAEAQQLLTQATQLEGKLGTAGGPIAKPTMQDVRGQLPQHASKRYLTRGMEQIRRVIVHHTVTSGAATPQILAQGQVGQGKAGITYHFLVAGDGTIYWTQPLDVAVEQTLSSAANSDGVAVALAGNFTAAPPPDSQLASAAKLIAWLLSDLTLKPECVVGRNEIDTTVGSPGAQWLTGAKYKETLVNAARSTLTG